MDNDSEIEGLRARLNAIVAALPVGTLETMTSEEVAKFRRVVAETLGLHACDAIRRTGDLLRESMPTERRLPTSETTDS